MSTKSNETTLRAMQMTTSDTPASPLRSFFHTCRSNSNTGLLVLFGVLFLTFSLYLPGRFATHDTLVSMMFQLPELGLLALAMLFPLLSGGFNLAIIATTNMAALLMAWIMTTYVDPTGGNAGLIVALALLAGAVRMVATPTVVEAARLPIALVASPRHADGLVLTGPISSNMVEALRICWDAMPEPKLVIAMGACAISGGVFAECAEIGRASCRERVSSPV